MRIKYFNHLLREEAQPHTLKDCKLVIDAQNYFYNMYKRSGLPHEVGCQSDSFAKYLKKELDMFKKANVECYFVFKGASHNATKRFENKIEKKDYDIISPIFTKNICKQVLDEMGFDYVTCQLESKKQCAVLADKLDCPTVSNDIELAIISNSHINYTSLKFNPTTNIISCKLLRFNTFLESKGLSKEKFFTFVLLTDSSIFAEDYFWKLQYKLKLPQDTLKRYSGLIKWLSQRSQHEALDQILKSFNADDRNVILQKSKEIETQLNQNSPGVPYQYFMEKNKIHIDKMDPQWFEKGIASRYISIPYIYLCRDDVIEGCWVFDDYTKPDALLLSIDIVKYAFNLLTNYTRETFILRRSNGDKITIDSIMPDVPKPNYPGSDVVFQNGWSDITQLLLFEHFLKNTIKNVDLEILRELPSEARLLMITLIYVAQINDNWGADEAYSVMTSYIAIGNISSLPRSEGKAVHQALASYRNSTSVNCSNEIVYPLLQFQLCLEQMNYLNALCGFPFTPTIFSKTYNAELVYNMLRCLKQSKSDAITHISQVLQLAPDTVRFLKNIADIHSKMVPLNN